MATDSLNELRRIGLLLKADAALPSVTTIVAGEPVRGSWWAHPAGRRIFRTLRDLSQRPDIVVVKFISGKDTLVHRSLWPELSRSKWLFQRDAMLSSELGNRYVAARVCYAGRGNLAA